MKANVLGEIYTYIGIWRERKKEPTRLKKYEIKKKRPKTIESIESDDWRCEKRSNEVMDPTKSLLFQPNDLVESLLLQVTTCDWYKISHRKWMKSVSGQCSVTKFHLPPSTVLSFVFVFHFYSFFITFDSLRFLYRSNWMLVRVTMVGWVQWWWLCLLL